jgi:exosortase/archaeosortase family protein
MASVRVVLPAMVFLVFLGGVTSNLGETGLRWLRDFSAGYSALFCRTFLSEDYVRQGYHIYLPDASGGGIRAAINVTTECGGYRSFLGMVLLALLFCSDPRVTLRRKFILACSSLALALGGNMVRLSISAMLNHCGQEHLVSGVFHPALGQMLIGIEAVLLYVLWRRLMRNVVEPVPEVNVETRVIQ